MKRDLLLVVCHGGPTHGSHGISVVFDGMFTVPPPILIVTGSTTGHYRFDRIESSGTMHYLWQEVE